MGLADSGPLLVPLALWVASALLLALMLRRSPSRVLLRLGALFVALWAVLATTTLLWIVEHGGVGAIAALAGNPARIFEPAALDAWIAGSFGALAVLTTAFLVNQGVARSLLRVLRTRPLPWPPRLEVERRRFRLLSFEGSAPTAFSFSLVELGPTGRPHRTEAILVSRALRDQLSPEELEAVVAHEVGHLVDLDGRYLTFVRTFARLVRWDPVVGAVARALTREEELRADDAAVAQTHRPLALARALLKSAEAATGPTAGAVGLLGAARGRASRELSARIERLVALHATGRYPEEPRGPP